MKILLPSLLLTILLYACSVTERNVTGTYKLKSASKTRLVLKDDKTFEFVKNFSEPGPQFLPDSTEWNFRTVGSWQLEENGKLVLNSSTQNGSFSEHAIDIVTPNTDITSFSFWDQYGDAVPIRLIRFPANRTKLYKGNIISFFADDFSNTDTIEFHFYGYRPYRWIVSPAQTGKNNQHRVTLYEQIRPGYFNNMVLTADRKKLLSGDRSFSLFKE